MKRDALVGSRKFGYLLNHLEKEKERRRFRCALRAPRLLLFLFALIGMCTTKDLVVMIMIVSQTGWCVFLKQNFDRPRLHLAVADRIQLSPEKSGRTPNVMNTQQYKIGRGEDDD